MGSETGWGTWDRGETLGDSVRREAAGVGAVLGL